MAVDYKKIVQAVAYLARKSGASGLNRLHAFKLLFLADRDHLRRCGSLITGDSYQAMKYGPVPVAAEHLLKSKRASESGNGYAAEYLIQKCVGHNRSFIFERNFDVDQLSQTDIDSLDVAWAVYQKNPDIVAFTHLFPEWKNAFDSIADGQSASLMKVEDFFLEAPPSAEYCQADRDWVEASRELYVESAWVNSL